MNPRSTFYRLINAMCHADITRILYLDTRSFVLPPDNPRLQCRVLDADTIRLLVSDAGVPINQAFADDAHRLAFLGVGAYANDELAGLSFYASDKVPARHNSGGAQFAGIGLQLPPDIRYQFKVSVMPAHRGQQLNAAMNACAINHWGRDNVSAIVTTTDWTNEFFLKSSQRQGFIRCGTAAEIVFMGRHLYKLPKPLEPGNGRLQYGHGSNADNAKDANAGVVRFVKGCTSKC